jgi:hypothetical protein
MAQHLSSTRARLGVAEPDPASNADWDVVTPSEPGPQRGTEVAMPSFTRHAQAR